MCSEDLILSWGNQVGIYIDDISDIWTVLGKITCECIHIIFCGESHIEPYQQPMPSALIFQITIILDGSKSPIDFVELHIIRGSRGFIEV